MAQVLVARVTCPSCSNQFQSPVDQVLDVRSDPSAKSRVLNGLVNMTDCPHCGARGALNLPFFYHDPDKELALVYMPMEAGQDNLQRQQVIGGYTKAVMDSLPAEERKAYLLQPQIYLTPQNMVNRILEADGVTPEMIEEQRAKVALLRRMIEATSDEVLEAMIKENDAAVDAEFLRLLTVNLEMAESNDDAANTQRLLKVRDRLLELSSAGRSALARSEVLRALREEPTREKLVDLLIDAPDEEMRRMLISFSQPLVDYRFFQHLTARIEAASEPSEKKRLGGLRTEVLGIRDQLTEEARELFETRAALLRQLLVSKNPEQLARRHFWELDEAFIAILRANLEEAQSTGNQNALAALQSVQEIVLQLAEEATPPEIRFLNRLMRAESDEDVDQVLADNRALVTERVVQVLEEAQANMPEDDADATERIATLLEKVRAVLGDRAARKATSGLYIP